MPLVGPSVQRPQGGADSGVPHRLRVNFERGLKGTTISRKTWPSAEVIVNTDTRMISVRASKRESFEFPIQDCTLHHSRLSTGSLGMCFKSRDCQLLFNGRPEATRRLFQDILAASQGSQRSFKGSAADDYKHLRGVPSKKTPTVLHGR